MHAVSGGVEGSVGDAMRSCILLGVYRGLGEGEARMPVVQEGGYGATYLAIEGYVVCYLGREGVDQMYIRMMMCIGICHAWSKLGVNVE